MSKRIAVIPFERISKIKVYVNRQQRSMERIQRDLGCDYLLGATTCQEESFAFTRFLVSGGRDFGKPQGEFGMSFFDEHAVLNYDNQVRYPHYVSGNPCFLQKGERRDTHSDCFLERPCSRAAIGYGADDLVLFCCSDGVDATTMDSLYTNMRGLGCDNAIQLGSQEGICCDFMGEQITTESIVPFYIAVWLAHEGRKKKVSVRTALRIREAAPSRMGLNGSDVVGTYPDGACVTVYEKRAGWYRTDRGWVCGLYLQENS